MKKAILIYSGGLDSTVLLHKLIKDGLAGGAIAFNYGQKHLKEIDIARKNCEKLKVDFQVADISSLSPIFGASALTNANTHIPQGAYEEGNMRATVVPNRNMIFLSIAAAYAITKKCAHLAYAAHSGDHALYPDCREEFALAADKALRLCDYAEISLLRPFVDMSKADIVKLGADLGVDFSSTWSCYKGGDIHCGLCGTCVERRQSFKFAGVKDPTVYEG